ncbi:MAG: DUF4917 family protein [Alphaproteobacteria bacterium]|nr:DUF4917 family protein [Alphaproteobacteria bacterium]
MMSIAKNKLVENDNNEVKIVSYNDMLEDIKNTTENHLLLGNGFNSSLCVNTSYKNIFERMTQEFTDYKKINIKKLNYDIEKLINYLKNNVKNDNEEKFYHNFFEKKIKYDFMKSAYSIVKENIKNVYDIERQGVYLLLKNFSNYFTLNYDPLLYLLLMNFKKDDTTTLAFTRTDLFKQEDLNANKNEIYSKIEEAYETGKLKIFTEDSSIEYPLKNQTKTDFISNIKSFFKNEINNKIYKINDLEKACNLLWKSKKTRPKDIKFEDGFFPEYNPERELIQNLFFLHGAFHIYKDKGIIKKITASQNKSLHNKLEEIINNDKSDIICVLKGESQEKEQAINENQYLRRGFNKLSSLTGKIVIFGSSLDDNDSHILNKINDSNVETVYISSSSSAKQKTYNKAIKYFSNKEIILFDYETVSYKKV